MNWMVGIILLGIVIGIARAYPKTSILIALILCICYVNRDSKDAAPKKKNNHPKTIHNSSNSNRIKPNTNYYKSNNLDSKRTYNYSPSIKFKTKTKVNNVKIRIGAVCNDGTTSKATGRGACSHHGGVDYWLYQ